MNKRETIDLLLYNVALEHSAIIQYLYNVFLIKDAEITSEIESIARQEMRHLKWFAQKVVDLGGRVSLRRVEEAIKVGKDWEEMLKNGVDAEEEAIKIYSEQLELVKDDSVKKFLDRVINDEMRHRDEFSELLQSLKEKEREETQESPPADPKVVKVLNELLSREYRLVLDYLYHFFHSRNWREKDTSLDIAIESMFHMGEIGEKIGEMGGVPDLSMPEARHVKGFSSQNLLEDMKEEEEAEKLFMKHARELKDRDLRELFEWFAKHEEYHLQRLKELLKGLKSFTVGSLIDKQD